MEADGKIISYQYDNTGNRTSMTDQFGQAVSYGYDSMGRLGTVTTGSLTTSYGYYNNGLLKQFIYPGSTKEAYEYTGEGNLSKVTNTKSNGTQINKYTYTYDASGNQDSKVEDGVTTNYIYDDLNRVETIEEAGIAVIAYTYDKAGNILSETNNCTKAARLAENFKYDELNRLIEYTDEAGTKTVYTYYPNGLRAAKTTNGHTTKYYYDGENVIIEAVDGALSARNLRGLNYIGRQDAAGTDDYYLYNGHGDVVKTVDSDGNVKNSYEYDIYGRVVNAVETGIPNPMRYAAQYYDEESGLYYLRARYYDPRIGRFISEDTNKGDINNPSSLNLYTYCWGNPLRYVDIDGHSPSNPLDKNIIFQTAKVIATGAAYQMVKMERFIAKSEEKLSEIWAKTPWARGWAIEKLDGGMMNNMKTIDKFIVSAEDGIATNVTSIKSLDILAKSYQTGNTLQNTVTRYIDKLAGYSGDVYKGMVIKLSESTTKVLELVIKSVNLSQEQMQQLQKASEHAKKAEVILKIIITEE